MQRSRRLRHGRLPHLHPDNSKIREQYFCDSAEGGNQAHLNVVTNQAPWPDLPAHCVYEE